MARHGENIYKRRDGRYEGRYVIGKTKEGKTRFGYVYARQFAEAKKMLLKRKQRSSANRLKAGARRISLFGMDVLLDGKRTVGEASRRLHITFTDVRSETICCRSWVTTICPELTPGVIHGFVEDLEASGLAGSTTKGAYRLLVRCAAFCSGRRHNRKESLPKNQSAWHTKQRAACADAARTGAHSLAFPNTGRSFRVAEPVTPACAWAKSVR